ncbi:MAG: hypothetical protein GVY36_16115 [Verrucomicrobia bacterium]|nr:hypothetical protein [Verrucomicrobiota bacterium]
MTTLFRKGHVVLFGLQGSGKTMLLNLLRPDIRKAYFDSGVDFPVPRNLRGFVGAGINLRRAGILEFSNLVYKESDSREKRRVCLLAGDFINYWILLDLITSIEHLRSFGDFDKDNHPCKNGHASLDRFASEFSKEVAWQGVFTEGSDIESLKNRIRARIREYRSLVTLSLSKEKEQALFESTASSVGSLISTAARLLKTEGVIKDTSEVFVHIDQYELLRQMDLSTEGLGESIQQVINVMMAERGDDVSYRVGTRHYGWPEKPRLMFSNDLLEVNRDYRVLDVDSRLRRRENRKTWIFPDFANDIFRRRIESSDYFEFDSDGSPLAAMLGKTPTPEEKAFDYFARKDEAETLIVNAPDNNEAMKLLRKFVRASPLDAVLANAWALQKGSNYRFEDVDGKMLPPWRLKSKAYWLKERKHQALMQLASARKQKLKWYGEDDVVGLSGGNILLFLMQCQCIVDCWLRANRQEHEASKGLRSLPAIDSETQAQGILEASEASIRKQREGDDARLREQLVRSLGRFFYERLSGDLRLSYPGSNGMSISDEELKNSESKMRLLKNAVRYGDLQDSDHTSKARGEKRRKFYLAQIYSPYFRIPFQRVKEPIYMDLQSLTEVLEKGGSVGSPREDDQGPTQTSIF